MILLGFEIPGGRPVEIPETGHLAWFGQTQLSGKTTALEAIAFRGNLKAVAFITKQGEGGFLTGRMIQPYFSEPTNDEEQPLWRWVKSILEASQQRKMNFEESWIIRACEDPTRAETLADVHKNIKALLAGEKKMVTKGRGKRAKQVEKIIRRPVSGMNAGVYTSLKAYFDIVMPQLARLPYTKKLILHAGLNVMDLRGYAMETQALVIRSVMEWVYLNEENVRVIVPEAQDFVPQGKNSPVKMACETLVRKAGANKNFMWLDSQDMAAVDKIMLRACSIVGIGVQTEAHEIDRSLAGLFTPALRPVDIARLRIGEFFVRTTEARVTKVYVMPAWMNSELHAQAIAKGELSVAGSREMMSAFKKELSKRDTPAPPQLLQIQCQEDSDAGSDGDSTTADSNGHVGTDRERAERGSSDAIEFGTAGSVGEPDSQTQTNEESEEMMAAPPLERRIDDRIRSYAKYHSKQLREMPDNFDDLLMDFIRDYENLLKAHDALAESVLKMEGLMFEAGMDDEAEPLAAKRKKDPAAAGAGNGLSMSAMQLEYIYRYVREAAQKDPSVIALLVRRPELKVTVETATVQMDDSSLLGKVAKLVHSGFFAKPQNGPAVAREMKRRGTDQPTTNWYKPLNKLAEMGFLTVESEGYQAVEEMKVRIAKA